MGKGDRKTAKGKLFKGSFGNSRPRPTKKSNTNVDAKQPGSSHQ